MKLWIDYQDLTGPVEVTAWIDEAIPPKITRRLNRATAFSATLTGEAGILKVPEDGMRIWLENDDTSMVFAGHVACIPQQEFVGVGVRGDLMRMNIEAVSDEYLLDRNPLPTMLPIPSGAAGEVIESLTEAACPGEFSLATGATDEVKCIAVGDGQCWSDVAGRVAGTVGLAYRAEDGNISLSKVGSKMHVIDDADGRFIPEALKVRQTGKGISDWTLFGELEPQAYVTDVFIGDGHTLRFPMAKQPYLRPAVTWLNEEFAQDLSPSVWSVVDPAKAVAVTAGRLVLGGGTGRDGETTLAATEELELGGCAVLEHGAFTVNAASVGVVGGLYGDEIKEPNCIAGFKLDKANGSTTLTALISGGSQGQTISLTQGHRYELTTRFFVLETNRIAQSYRSSIKTREGNDIDADVRFVMEMRDLDGGDEIAEAVVMYDGVVAAAAVSAKYALVNARSMFGSVQYTRVRLMPMAEVRTTSIATGLTRTRIVGGIEDGAECSITSEPAVYFYSSFKPANGDQIVVRSRAQGRASARVIDTGSAFSSARIARIAWPVARNSEDCARAAAALLDESVHAPLAGEYTTWTDLLPNGSISPGDAVEIKASRRGVEFAAVIREVEQEIVGGLNERSKFTIKFENEAASPVGIECGDFTVPQNTVLVTRTKDGIPGVASLVNAAVTALALDKVTVDAGCEVVVGGGIEVRRESDSGWGAGIDRNLIGRFATRQFDVPRGTRSENYYLRMYDGAVPPNYSAVTTLLHVDVKDDSI